MVLIIRNVIIPIITNRPRLINERTNAQQSIILIVSVGSTNIIVEERLNKAR